MKRRTLSPKLAFKMTTIALSIGVFPITGFAVTTTVPLIYGTLSNFDVVNDTGQPTHGFEIELEDVSPGDVSYTFGDSYDPSAPYIRYGKAKYIERNSAGTGTIIRYAGTYDPILKKFVEATPPAVSPYPKTIGHTCYRLGDPLRYWTSGCEHFGMTVHRKPTKTTYRWLVGDPAAGTLKVLGSPGNASIPAPIKIPAPVWNVNQPPPPPGIAPAQPPLVVAVVQAPPAPPTPLGEVGRWGEAIWMKIYKSEFPHVVALDDLVLGGDAVANPDVDPAEVEWKLLQSPPIGKSGAGEMSENGGDAPVGEGSEAVSRRYEYYKYTGQYDTDPSNLGEAFCDDPVGLEQQLPQSAVCGAPDDNGVAGVGDFIGAQNGAVNLLAACANNVSNSISIARSGYSFNFTTKLFSQKITLTNTSNAPIYGPMSLAFDNLGNNVQLSTPAGYTTCLAPLGSVFASTAVNTSVDSLAPGQSTVVVARFYNPGRAGITYTPRVLATSGLR